MSLPGPPSKTHNPLCCSEVAGWQPLAAWGQLTSFRLELRGRGPCRQGMYLVMQGDPRPLSGQTPHSCLALCHSAGVRTLILARSLILRPSGGTDQSSLGCGPWGRQLLQPP